MGLFSKPIKTLDDLFVHTLQDIYYAENQITKALPTMIGKATDPPLKQAFETHLSETKGQITRLEKVFEMHGQPVKGVTCAAMDGILAEAREIMGDVSDTKVLDAAPDRVRAGGGTLRDHPLRHAGRAGQAVGPARLRRRAGNDPGGGEGDGSEAVHAGRRRGQPEGGLIRRTRPARAASHPPPATMHAATTVATVRGVKPAAMSKSVESTGVA